MSPLVSVIIPAYCCEKTLESSVRSALLGTVRDIEVIVADDASTDGTAAAAQRLSKEDPRVSLIRLPKNGGAAAARNRGVEAAKAEWIAFLDADDIWEPEKLYMELAEAERTQASLVYCAAACIDERGERTGKIFSVPATVTANGLLCGNDIVTSTVLIKRDVYRKHPMERSDLHEDLICWYRILKDGEKAVGLNEPLVRYRVTGGSKSGNKLRSARMMWNSCRYLGVGFFRRAASFVGYCLHGIGRYWI